MKVLKGKDFFQKKPEPPQFYSPWVIKVQSKVNHKATKKCFSKRNLNLKKEFIWMMSMNFYRSNLKRHRKGKINRNTWKFCKCWEMIWFTNANNVERVRKAQSNMRNTWLNILKKNLKKERKENKVCFWWMLMNGPIEVPIAVYNNSISFILALAI